MGATLLETHTRAFGFAALDGNAECNEGKLGCNSLRDMMEPMVNDAESVHAGAYQFGDGALSGDAGGGETFFKKYVCPDKFQWHSGLVVTDSKILAYFIKNCSAERMSTIAITTIPVDKIKASSLFHLQMPPWNAAAIQEGAPKRAARPVSLPLALLVRACCK